METLESLRRRMEGTEELLSVVKTMKAMAAVSIRQYEKAVVALAEYNRTVEMGLHVALRHRPDGVEIQPDHEPDSAEKVGVVVLGSDQGLCGRFNERIAEYSLNTLNGMHIAHHDRSLLTVGRRVTGRLEAARQPIQEAFSMPSSVDGIGATVQMLLMHLESWRTRRNINRIMIFYNRSGAEISYTPQMVQIFPLDLDWLMRLTATPWQSQGLPTIFTEWEPLLRGLLRQYFLVALHRAVAESLAGENASRLASMQAAERNIEEYLAAFQAAYQQGRQNAITSELLDIIGGYEALTQH